MSFQYFSKNGHVLPNTDANIPLSNIAYQYGFGVYESIKARNGIVYFVEKHIERLLKSAEIIGLEHAFHKEKIGRYIEELKNNLIEGNTERKESSSYNLKILLIGGKTKEEAQLFILPLAPLFPDRKVYTDGAKTITAQYERLFPNAKTLNMLGSFLAYKKAKERGGYDALLVNHHGNILEGTRTNFFTIKDKTIFTPAAKYILEGVTRKTVLSVAKKHGYTIEEWDIALKQVEEGEYDGAFLTSTSSKIIPIKQIDAFIFPKIPDPLQALMKVYDEFLEESSGIFGK